MIFLRYIITIFFIYILISLSVLRFSVVYLENNKELLESYLSYINYNYIIKSSGTEESENSSKKKHEMRQIEIQDIKGNWKGVYPSLSLQIKNLSDYKSSNVRFPNLIELKLNIYKSAIFFKPVIKSLYIENVYYKSSLEKIFSKLKESNKIKSISIDNIQIGNSKFEILYKNNSYKLENANISIKKSSINFDSLLDENKIINVELNDIVYKKGKLENISYQAKIKGKFDYDFKNRQIKKNISINGNNISFIISGKYNNNEFLDNKVTFDAKNKSNIKFDNIIIDNLYSKIIFNKTKDNIFLIEFNDIEFTSKNNNFYKFKNLCLDFNLTNKNVSLFLEDINIDLKNYYEDFNISSNNKKIILVSKIKNLKAKFNLNDPSEYYFFQGSFFNANFSYNDLYLENFTGIISSNLDSTYIDLNSNNLVLKNKLYLRNELQFNKVTGKIRISDYKKPITFISDLELSNDQIDVKSSGIINNSDNVIKLSSYIRKVDMKYISNYLPKSFMSNKTANYFKKSFQSGFAKSANIFIDGNLSDYPFYDNYSGISYANFPIKDLSIDYKKGWVPFKNVTGDAYFKKNKAYFKSENFKILNTTLSKGKLYIDNVRDTALWMKGTLDGPFKDLLEFSNKASLTNINKGTIKSISGNSLTDFKIKIAFNKSNNNYYESKIKLKKVNYSFNKNNNFSGINGEIKYKNNKFFTEKNKFIKANYNKVKVKFDLKTNQKGNFIVSGSQRINADKLINDGEIKNHINGESLWDYTINFPSFNSSSSVINVKAESNLQGVTVLYPKPFLKKKDEKNNTYFELDINKSELTNIKISYNKIYSEFLSLKNLNGYINFSGKKSSVPESKINLLGNIDLLNLDDWKKLNSESSKIDYLSYVNKIDVFLKKFTSHKLILDNLKIKGREATNIFIFDEIASNNEIFNLSASGKIENNNISSFKINIDSINLENLLNYWNFDHSLRDASMTSNLDISWKGSLFDFSLKGLYGKFSMNMKDGRLKKVGNRATRIFGLFNIDLLAKRLSLDFDDVTKNGFYFNSLNGDFRLNSGNIFTTNLLIKGPSAELLTVGTTNYIDETYDMQVVASPEFGETLPAIALLGGPITAAATFAAEKLAKAFGRDINDLIKIKYKVTGTWNNPKIKIINKKTDALDDVEELLE